MTARETGGTAGWALSEASSVLGGRPVGYARYAGRNLRAAFRHLLAEEAVDLVHFDHVHAAQLLPDARALAPRARTVMDAHNVEAQVAERLAEVSRWPLSLLLRRQAAAIARLVDLHAVPAAFPWIPGVVVPDAHIDDAGAASDLSDLPSPPSAILH